MLKTLFTGWLLIAQYNLAQPTAQESNAPSTPVFNLQRQRSDASVASSTGMPPHSPTTRVSSSILSQRKRVSQLRAGEKSATSALDFGRFRRQLEERRQSESLSSSVEPSSSTLHRSQQWIDRMESTDREALYNDRRAMSALDRVGSSTSRRQREDDDSELRGTLAERSKTQSQRVAGRSSSSLQFTPATDKFTFSRHSSTMPNPFHVEGKPGPTSTLIGSTTLYSANSPNRRKRSYASLSQHPAPVTYGKNNHPGARQRSGRRSIHQDAHRHSSGTRASRRSVDASKADDDGHRRKQARRSGETEERRSVEETSSKLSLPAQQRQSTLRPVAQAFPRPKPPGKNRTGLVTSPRNDVSSTSGSRIQAAAVDKGKGQSTPRLNNDRHGGGASERRDGTVSHKRKAFQQLHNAEPKRMAFSPYYDGDSDDDDDHSGRNDHDDNDDRIVGERRHHGEEEPLLLTPKDIQRTYDALNGVDSREPAKQASHATNSSNQESETTAVDWSRFLKSRPVHHQRRRSGAELRRESSWTSTTPTLTKQLSTETYLHSHSAFKTNLSPLIKLRQSQLKQQQQEDLLGSKRRDTETEAGQDIDGKGHFLFERTLEDWEREDREIAAAAAAEEAALAAKGRLFKGQSREMTSLATTTLSTEPSKEAPLSSSRPKQYKVPSTPSDSLLQTISFSGGPPKRPVPNFGQAGSGKRFEKVDVDFRQEQPLKRSASRTTLQHHHQQPQQPQQQYQKRLLSTRRATTKSGHPGLYTPSKSAKYFMMDGGPSTPEKVVSTPTMSRYLEHSVRDENEDNYDDD
ncbi:hypothetical protein BGW42_004223 [Actinomortierella wolfii]|nr:hypothetical protein BGW42_004223 [Actinomortierella wolfii]